MRKFLIVLAILAMAAPALGADVLINSKIDSITVAQDKNGDTYVRAIITETRSLRGEEYTDGVAVVGFREQGEAMMNLKEGDTIKAICEQREYNGRTSYRVLKLVQ